MLDHLTPLMREFIERMTMAFIATSDAHGECDSSFRAGPPGFMRVIDEKTVMWPEYKGNGVMASMGNINENGYVGLLFVDFFETAVGLHVNGTATVVENAAVEAFAAAVRPASVRDRAGDQRRRQEDARALGRGLDRRGLHPLLQAHPDAAVRARGQQDSGRRAGDVFKAKNAERAWLQPTCEIELPVEEPVIGDVKFADEPPPTHAASGRRLPLPLRK